MNTLHHSLVKRVPPGTTPLVRCNGGCKFDKCPHKEPHSLIDACLLNDCAACGREVACTLVGFYVPTYLVKTFRYNTQAAEVKQP